MATLLAEIVSGN